MRTGPKYIRRECCGVVKDCLWPTSVAPDWLLLSWDTGTLIQGWVVHATSDAWIWHWSYLNSNDTILVSQIVRNQKKVWECYPNLGFSIPSTFAFLICHLSLLISYCVLAFYMSGNFISSQLECSYWYRHTTLVCLSWTNFQKHHL